MVKLAKKGGMGKEIDELRIGDCGLQIEKNMNKFSNSKSAIRNPQLPGALTKGWNMI